MAGIAGQQTSLPYVREGSFFLSGYKHPDIWVAPTPLHDFGWASTLFKQMELTRVKFTSLIKVEILAMIVLTISGLFYWSYIQRIGSVPGDMYPFAQEVWPFYAKNAALWTSAMGEGNQEMISAIQPTVIGGAAVVFVALFAVMSLLNIPLAFWFGAVGGVGQFPYIAITMLLGLGVRVLVARRLGKENLKRYSPVMVAGFAAGFGIAGMLVVAIVLVKSAISGLLY